MNSKAKRVKLLGLPYEGRENFLRGASLAPGHIRFALESIEEFSIYQGRALPDYLDLGDHYPGGTGVEFVTRAEALLRELLRPGERFIVLGGDHLVTLPVVRWLRAHLGPGEDELAVLQLDAHLDRRDSFLGERFDHATVMARVAELGVPIYSWGVRSRAPDEEWPETALRPEADPSALSHWLRGHERIYLTLDLDVLNPGEFAAVSNPEPGGPRFPELLRVLSDLDWSRVVGLDLVEFVPPAGGFKDAVLAAVLLRELLVLLGSGYGSGLGSERQ